jgi:hypothetical protein
MEPHHNLVLTASFLTIFGKVFQIFIRDVDFAVAPTPPTICIIAFSNITVFVLVLVTGAMPSAAVPSPPVLLSTSARSVAKHPAPSMSALHARTLAVLVLHGHLNSSSTGSHGR